MARRDQSTPNDRTRFALKESWAELFDLLDETRELHDEQAFAAALACEVELPSGEWKQFGDLTSEDLSELNLYLAARARPRLNRYSRHSLDEF